MTKLFLSLALIWSPIASAGAYIDNSDGCGAYHYFAEKFSNPGVTFTWTGTCENGFARGKGTLKWFTNGVPSGTFVGEMYSDRPGLPGYGKYQWPGEAPYTGEYVVSQYNEVSKKPSMQQLEFSARQLLNKSEGDNVCVYAWGDENGFCGSIEKVTKEKYKIKIEHIKCGSFGCKASASCGNMHIGGPSGEREDKEIWVNKSCVSN